MSITEQQQGRYAGKSVVVTGGTSGMGLATAQHLADGGARVLVTGRSSSGLREAERRFGPNAVALRSDATDSRDIAALAAQVRGEVGRLDGLFVNAGGAQFAPFADVDETAYDALMAVNARGPYFTIQALRPLLAPGSGVVVTTSITNVLGAPDLSVYAASKAALRSMVRSLARELLPQRVRVNAVSPGAIDTGRLEATLAPGDVDAARAQTQAETPMGRFGRPDEIAVAAAFLLFDATYTTGAELVVDGGVSQL